MVVAFNWGKPAGEGRFHAWTRPGPGLGQKKGLNALHYPTKTEMKFSNLKFESKALNVPHHLLRVSR